MVSASDDFGDLDAVEEDFDRGLRVRVHDIVEAQLAMLIVAHSVEATRLAEEQVVELARGDVNDRLVEHIEILDSVVDVEDLALAAVCVELLAELEAIVLSDSIDVALLAEVESMLEAK